MQNDELKKLIQSKEEITARINEESQSTLNLNEKFMHTERSLPDLEENIKIALKKKQKAMDLFVTDKLSQADLEKADNDFFEAERQKNRAQEMLKAIDRARDQAGKKILELNNKLYAADRAIWNFIFERTKDDIRKKVGQEILRAYAAFQRCGGASWPSFLPILLDFGPSFDEVNKIQTDLASEYGIQDE